MSASKKILTLFALTIAMAAPISSFSQTATEHYKTDSTPMPAALTDGEVKKIDLDNSKITIKHSDIKHLDMPGMTMVFTATNKNLLTHIKPGDKIRFMAVTEAGKMVVTEIQPVQ